MTTRHRVDTSGDRAQHDVREQEVLRANKELAAYFKGQRTEREARAALKTIKAFVRDRERMDPAHRRPLPGAETRASGSLRKPQQTRRHVKARQRDASGPVRGEDLTHPEDPSDVAAGKGAPERSPEQ